MLKRDQPPTAKDLRARAFIVLAVLGYLVVQGVVGLLTDEPVYFLADQLPWLEYGLLTAGVGVLALILVRRWRRATHAERAFEAADAETDKETAGDDADGSPRDRLS
jgi:protein-S-isoprenylcysteine O-methyltransferase Ste14